MLFFPKGKHPCLSPSYLLVLSGPGRGALWLPPSLGCLSASGTGRELGAWALWAMQGRQGLHLAFIHCHAPQETAQSGRGLGIHATSWETEHQRGALRGVPRPLYQDLSASTGMKAKGGRREPRAWQQAEHQWRGLEEFVHLSTRLLHL